MECFYEDVVFVTEGHTRLFPFLAICLFTLLGYNHLCVCMFFVFIFLGSCVSSRHNTKSCLVVGQDENVVSKKNRAECKNGVSVREWNAVLLESCGIVLVGYSVHCLGFAVFFLVSDVIDGAPI